MSAANHPAGDFSMKNIIASIGFLCAVVLHVSTAVAEEPDRRFTATAVVTDSMGTRSMPMTLVANRFTSVEQARHLAEVLEQGGQGALLSALSGRSDGQLMLGALQMPVALVVVEAQGSGHRYLFLTPRTIKVAETTLDEESLDYPFGIAVFEVDDFGDGVGDGRLHVAAALSIDSDGHIEVDDYDGADGSLEDVSVQR
jgi:hypothetical protein